MKGCAIPRGLIRKVSMNRMQKPRAIDRYQIINAHHLIDQVRTIFQENRPDVRVRFQNLAPCPWVVGVPIHLGDTFLTLCLTASRVIQDFGAISIKTLNVKGRQTHREVFKDRPEAYLSISIQTEGRLISLPGLKEEKAEFQLLQSCLVIEDHNGILEIEKLYNGIRFVLSLPSVSADADPSYFFDDQD
jgi:hypothetical protein